jgi:IS30 family transposase
MKNYKQLCLAQRYQTQCLFNVELSQIKMAEQISVHRSTVSQELMSNIPKRGSNAGKYIGEQAQRETDLSGISEAKQVLLNYALKKQIADG